MQIALEDKMKIFVVLLLLSAFSAYVSANEMFPTAVIDFLEERHDEGMVQVLRDNGLPEDTLVLAERGQQPDWLVSKNSFFLKGNGSRILAKLRHRK